MKIIKNNYNELCKKLAKVRKQGVVKYLRPDGKAQVTVEYDENGKPVKDENDVEIYISDNLKDVDVATLLIEAAEDHVLTDEMKADVRSRLKEGYTHKVISPGAHMSFCTADSDDVLKVFNDDGDGISESDKQAQRTQTVAYVLEFVKNLSK